MSETETLAQLYAQLTKDAWRDDHPFSDDILEVNGILHFPFTRESERREALENWMQGNQQQPCLFGRLAAKRDGIMICFLTTEEILQSDDAVRAKIQEARTLWKRRALRGEPRHGFILSVCDAKVTYAEPNDALRWFSLRVQELAGWPSRADFRDNDVADEWVYLQHPESLEIAKFTFSVDYFASAADGRWWHDHRVPGGLAFTANSLGHMVRHHEWYGKKADRIEWALRTAMLTIAAAEPDKPHCPATYLLDEAKNHGRPIRPYNWAEATPPPKLEKLKGKDCGSYAGYLHTDHAIRREFFLPGDAPEYKDKPYLMDFAYIFDTATVDHAPFMAGERVTEAEVDADLGPPGDMRTIAADAPTPPAEHRPDAFTKQIRDALERTRAWRMSDEEEASLL